MRPYLVIGIVLALLLCCAGFVYSLFAREGNTLPATVIPTEAQSAVKLLQYSNPGISTEIAQEYLRRLEALNNEFGFTGKNAQPNGDISIMEKYGGRVTQIQEELSIRAPGTLESDDVIPEVPKAPTLPLVPKPGVATTPALVQQKATTPNLLGAPSPQQMTTQPGGKTGTPPLVQPKTPLPPAPPIPQF